MGDAVVAQGFVALYVFMLAAIAGHVIISRVPVILHTPLMSGSIAGAASGGAWLASSVTVCSIRWLTPRPAGG